MAVILYHCPRTGMRAQSWFAEDSSTGGERNLDTYVSVACPACSQLHMVNQATGKVLGQGGRGMIFLGGDVR
jgi:hypothetical protein